MTHDENAREDFQKVKSLERQVESLKKRVAELESFVYKTKSGDTPIEEIRNGTGLRPFIYDNDGLAPWFRKGSY